MNDNQRTSVVAAIKATTLQDATLGGPEVVAEACRALGVPRPEVSETSRLLVTRRRVELPELSGALTALHAVAHIATDPMFPPHGAEFCAVLLDLADRLSPRTADILRQEFDTRRVYYTADQRRRAVVKAVTQRAADGTLAVRAVLDDPPEDVTGPLRYSRETRAIRVGDRWIPLTRLRYLAKVR